MTVTSRCGLFLLAAGMAAAVACSSSNPSQRERDLQATISALQATRVVAPTLAPSASPTPEATRVPTPTPTPSASPSPEPTASPTASPTATLPPPSPTVAPCTETDAAARLRASLVRIEVPAEGVMGSGVVLGADGTLLTNAHVVGAARGVIITLPTGKQVSGQVIASLKDRDLALIKVAANALAPITWGDDQSLQPGQRLLALGYAKDLPGEPTLTGGLFSAHRPLDGQTYVQTDTALNPGNSGGPLFTLCGEVIGIVDWSLRNSQALNFAISATDVQAALPALTAGTTRPASAAATVIIPAEVAQARPTVIIPALAAVGSAPTDAVRLFYTALARADYTTAYNLLSASFRAQTPFTQFRAGYATTTSVVLVYVNQITASSPEVSVIFRATDQQGQKQISRTFTGTWTLVLETGGWKLDVGKIHVVQ